MKVIETEYKGYKFRSRLEARWAVFFDACGVQWEYEVEGYDLGGGLRYLPDFLLHGVALRSPDPPLYDIYVEVKGQMTARDAEKLVRFAAAEPTLEKTPCKMDGVGENNPILIVGNLPYAESEDDYIDFMWEAINKNRMPEFGFFSFELIDYDYYPALPGLSLAGEFVLYGSDYMETFDDDATLAAYNKARQARFERRVKEARQ